MALKPWIFLIADIFFFYQKFQLHIFGIVIIIKLNFSFFVLIINLIIIINIMFKNHIKLRSRQSSTALHKSRKSLQFSKKKTKFFVL